MSIERPDELLDEERVALRPLDHDVADVCGKLGRNEVVEHTSRIRG